jgi:hypothetical protein
MTVKSGVDRQGTVGTWANLGSNTTGPSYNGTTWTTQFSTNCNGTGTRTYRTRGAGNTPGGSSPGEEDARASVAEWFPGARGSAMALVTALALALAVVGCSREEPGPLDDGQVTQAEYDGALDAAVRCIEEKGYVFDRFRDNYDGITKSIVVSFPDAGSESVGDEAAAEEEKLNAQDYCVAVHVFDVEKQWFAQHVPEGAERDQMWESLVQCLAEWGVTGVTPGDSTEEIVAAVFDADPDGLDGLECLDKHRMLWPEDFYQQPPAYVPAVVEVELAACGGGGGWRWGGWGG